MKSIKHIAVAMVLLLLCILPAAAQQYDTATIKTVGGTNATATATNIATAVTLTKYDQFALEFSVGLTNAATGSIDVQWDTGIDGSNFSTGAAVGSSGWFAVPLTNAGAVSRWTTNITINSVGYWRANWTTNNSGQSLTNLTIKRVLKPKRQG